MLPEDWGPGPHCKEWAQSDLWKNSEAMKKQESFHERGIHPVEPNFPPTYQCSSGLEKTYGLCKQKGGVEVYDVRAPSWTDLLMVMGTEW